MPLKTKRIVSNAFKLFYLEPTQNALSGYYFTGKLINQNFSRHTLEKCNLSTEDLPKSSRRNLVQNESQSEATSTETKPWTANGLDEIWQKLQENERMRRRSFYRTDLFNGIKKNKQLALQRIENHKRMAELINDEIEEIQRRTGVTQVLLAKINFRYQKARFSGT